MKIDLSKQMRFDLDVDIKQCTDATFYRINIDIKDVGSMNDLSRMISDKMSRYNSRNAIILLNTFAYKTFLFHAQGMVRDFHGTPVFWVKELTEPVVVSWPERFYSLREHEEPKTDLGDLVDALIWNKKRIEMKESGEGEL